MSAGNVSIVTWDPRYAPAFDRLNRAWLMEHDLLEDGDLPHLEQPEASIIAPGGEIFVALERGQVVGTAAVVIHDAHTVELSKLAVDPSARGRGIGQHLTETAIAWATGRGARKIVLLSSTKLGPAIALYERLGFRHVALPPNPAYATADVCMELDLGRDESRRPTTS